MDRVETIKSWYKDWLENIQSVHSIFIDTFGEDRVDLQDVVHEDAFISHISDYNILHIREIFRNNGILFNFSTLSFGCLSEVGDFDFGESYEAFKESYLNSVVCPNIIIHFPEVIIENEQGLQHTIKDFFARVKISGTGTYIAGPHFKRATFSKAECLVDYSHSHIAGIHPEEIGNWRQGCLGSGPINSTIARLSTGNSWEDWVLFTVQLDQYVHTESLAGGPYRYLSKINSGVSFSNYNMMFLFPHPSNADSPSFLSGLPISFPTASFSMGSFQEFLNYLCLEIPNTNLAIEYIGNRYDIGGSLADGTLEISKVFIKWFNEKRQISQNFVTYPELLNLNYLIRAKVIGGKLVCFYPSNNISFNSYQQYIGAYVHQFKGKIFTFTIEPYNTEKVTDVPNSIKVLHPFLVLKALYTISSYINLYYGNTNNPAFRNEGCIRAT